MPDIVQLEQGMLGDVQARASALLSQGRLIALRTAGVYRVVGRVFAEPAIRGIMDLPGLGPIPELVLGRVEEWWDWLPHYRGPGLRMIRRFWPGPVKFLVKDGFAQGLWQCLPNFTQSMFARAGGLPLALAEAPWLAGWGRSSEGPLVQIEATPAVASAEQAAKHWGEGVELIVDTPLSPSGDTTWVELQGKTWRLMHEGSIPRADLAEAAPCRMVFVCTGNTCRSPLAAALARKLLADRLFCTQAELTQRGFCVQSAGLAAMMGSAATPEAVEAAHDHGADLSDHQSRPLNLEMLAYADFLLAMTQSHLRLLESLNLEVGPRPRLLSPQGEDIDDPIGAGPEVYQACAAQILDALKERLPEFLES